MTRVMTLALLLMLATPAWADVLPIYDAPHQLACKRKKVGDACTFQGPDKKPRTGTCAKREECSVNATAQHYYEKAMRDHKPQPIKPGSDMSPPEPPQPPKPRCTTVYECEVTKTPDAAQAEPKTTDKSQDTKAPANKPSKTSSCASAPGPSLPAPVLVLLGLLGLLSARPRRRS